MLFTATSIFSIFVMASRRRKAATRDQRRLRVSMIGLFAMMIAIFLLLTFVRERVALIQVLDVVVRATPLMFLLVSVLSSRIASSSTTSSSSAACCCF